MRTGENIYHRKDGRWEARFIAGRRVDGRAQYKSFYAKTYGEAKKKALEARAQPPLTAKNPLAKSALLRHTYATRCIELGFDAKTLSELLGHSNVNVTLNRYVHSSQALKREWMSKFIL
jgi:integrase